MIFANPGSEAAAAEVVASVESATPVIHVGALDAALTGVLFDGTIPKHERLVFAQMWSQSEIDEDRRVVPWTDEEAAKQCGVGLSTMQRVIASLTKVGLIRRCKIATAFAGQYARGFWLAPNSQRERAAAQPRRREPAVPKVSIPESPAMPPGARAAARIQARLAKQQASEG